MDFWAVRDGMALKPAGEDSGSVISRLPTGKVIHVEVKQPRNAGMHRLYWTLCSRIADAIGCESEDISHILKKRTGHIRHIKTKKGWEEVPRSISWAKMDQVSFKAFFDKCLVVIETEIGVARADALEAVKDLIEATA